MTVNFATILSRILVFKATIDNQIITLKFYKIPVTLAELPTAHLFIICVLLQRPSGLQALVNTTTNKQIL